MKQNILTLALLTITLLFVTCQKYEPITKLTTVDATATGALTATANGKIIELSSDGHSQYGFCYSTTVNPTIVDGKVELGSPKSGDFTGNIVGLTASTTYYIRSFCNEGGGFLYGEQKTFTTTDGKPVLTTTAANAITATTATGGGDIAGDGGAAITARGVCWALTSSPTTANNKTSDGTGTGIWVSELVELDINTTYYIRAYGTNSLGTVYGNELSFTTANGKPLLSTTAITAKAIASATSGGNITSDGGSVITSRGVCWSTNANPTTANSNTVNGTGTGTFTSNLTALSGSTTYYVRAYATNSIGTVYGNEVSFSTTDGTPVLTTTTVTAIGSTSATSGGNVTSDGGSAITARGVCWATTTNPTILNSKTSNGTGKGGFISNLTALSVTTTYYVRAYATNSIGTVYGNEQTFTTTIPDGPGSPITDNDGNTYNTVWIGGKLWMAENLKTTKYSDGTAIINTTDNTAWLTQTVGAYCWYNNDIANKSTYGAMYNWYAVNTGKLAPTGWHVPTDAEWTQLTNYLGGEAVAGGKMKSTTTWSSPNTGATNSSGFAAFAGGGRYASGGAFADMIYFGNWWSSTANGASAAWNRSLSYSDAKVNRANGYLTGGMSVRCVRD